ECAGERTTPTPAAVSDVPEDALGPRLPMLASEVEIAALWVYSFGVRVKHTCHRRAVPIYVAARADWRPGAPNLRGVLAPEPYAPSHTRLAAVGTGDRVLEPERRAEV